VVSLADRQMLELKDRNRQLEARLHQLIRHGEANDQIIHSAHRLSLALQRCLNLQQVADGLASCFQQDFALDRMALRLWHPAAESSPLYNARHEVQALARNLSAPTAAPMSMTKSWAGSCHAGTAVIQPDPADRCQWHAFGLLVLASDDASALPSTCTPTIWRKWAKSFPQPCCAYWDRHDGNNWGWLLILLLLAICCTSCGGRLRHAAR
jgi:hypothetical protein